MDTIWITGTQGLIGSHLLKAYRADPDPTRSRIIGWTRDSMDLADPASIAQAFRGGPPDLVIHCAAMSRSPECQSQPELARRINVDATRELAERAGTGRFIFLSTDLVFDGSQGNYRESDPVGPLSCYAETKVRAEEALARHPNCLIVRTSLNGGVSPKGNRGFNEEIVNAWKRGKELHLFTDEFRSPIAVPLTCAAIRQLAAGRATGVIHVAGEERLSRYQIGELLAARHPEVTPRYQASSLRDYCGAPRAPDTSLDCRQAQALLTFPLQGLRQWLKDHPESPF